MLSLGVTTPARGYASAMDDLTKVKQILWEVWDPIGVNGEPDAFGEYDSYAPHILNLLQSGASEDQLANALDHITNDLMGLGAGGHKIAVAALLALRVR